MRLYYFDDSGPRKRDPDNPYFVQAGYGIDSERLPALTEAIITVAARFGLDLTEYPCELKFGHLGNRRHTEVKPNWMDRVGLNTVAKRRALVIACLDALASAPSVTLLGVGVNQMHPDLADGAPIVHALVPLLERANFDCEDNQCSGLAFFDEEQVDMRTMRAARRAGSRNTALAKVLEMTFMESEDSVPLQLADLVAGTLSRFLNSGDCGYLRIVHGRFGTRHGVVDGAGIKLIPAGSVPVLSPLPNPLPPLDREVEEFYRPPRVKIEWLPSGALVLDGRESLATGGLGGPRGGCTPPGRFLGYQNRL